MIKPNLLLSYFAKMDNFQSDAVITLLCTVFIYLPGCQPKSSVNVKAGLRMAYSQFNARQYTSAVQTITQLINNSPNSKQVAEYYYLRGLCYRRMPGPDYALAKKDLQTALQFSRNRKLSFLINTALGHTYYENINPDYAKAIEYYQAALKAMPSPPPTGVNVDAVRFRLAVSLQRMGRWRQADKFLSQCIYARSGYSSEARKLFGCNAFSVQVGVFGDMKNVHKVVNKLKQVGLRGRWVPITVKGKVLYAVQCGYYNTYASAKQALGHVKNFYASSIIVAVNKGMQKGA